MMSVAGDIGEDQFDLCDAECALALLIRYEVTVKFTGPILEYTPKYSTWNWSQIRSVRTEMSR
jgi:hypothetical protein